MKDVQCCELFGGIALKNHAFSFFLGGSRFLLSSLLNSFFSRPCLFVLVLNGLSSR